MKVPSSLAVVSLLSLADNVQSAITLPLKPIDKKLSAIIKQSTKTDDKTVITVPVKDWIKHTADLQWYTEVEVGTPSQKFNVIFDTGSFDMFIADKNCTDCSKSRLFDSDQSSSFSDQPGNRDSFDYGTGVDSTPLPPGGEGVSGRYVTDRVGIAGHYVDQQQFLLCDDYPDFMNDVPFDGVMGIGQQGVSSLPSGQPWYWALYGTGQLEGPEFAMYYPAGKEDGAEMTLGGTNPARYTGDIHKVDLIGNGNFVVRQPSLAINGKNFSPAAGRTTILDSGTAYFATDDQLVTAIYKAISPKIKKLNQEAWGVSCDIVESLAVSFTFAFGEGSDLFNATMPKEAFNLGPYEGMPGICQTVFSSLSIGSKTFLIGAPLLKQYYTVWDGLNLKMGFAELKN